MPTPCLSFAVRRLHCAAGIVITASHNPAAYNGYKVYGADGCQITSEAAKAIQKSIDKCSYFDNHSENTCETDVEAGLISSISDEVITEYIESVKGEALTNDLDLDKRIRIVYTPLNGTGLKPVCRVLKECGYQQIMVVPEQEKPDGHFPTCLKPNPEEKEAMRLGIALAQKEDAELVLATDPDCDRVGIAVKDDQGTFILLNANETGTLLLDYICQRRRALDAMPEQPVFCKTIVTTDLAQRIAEHYGVETINTLTGFKYIGEQIGRLESAGRGDAYIFGFEESYGFLSGTYVRDKDGVNASLLICEMFVYYKNMGKSLCQRLNDIYSEYGYCLNTQHAYQFEGATGQAKMTAVMEHFRSGIKTFGTYKVLKCLDYSQGLGELPKSNVIKFVLEDNCSVVIRPSGTEPKLKVYLSVNAENKEKAEGVEEELISTVIEKLN